MSTEELQPTKARERRNKNVFMHRVSPDLVVKMRRMSMTTIVMEGLMPFNLLDAAGKFEEISRKVAEGLASGGVGQGAEALNGADPKINQDTMAFLRHYAQVVVLEPPIVAEDDGNPDHLPVKELEAEELMSIFYALPPGQEADKKEEVPLTNERAEDFRGEERPGPVPADIHGGEGVSPAAKLLDFPEREAING